MGKAFEFTEKQQDCYNNCTKLQRRIIINIVRGNMLNREAYYASGGKAKSNTSADSTVTQILRKPQCKSFLESLTEEQAGDAIHTRKEILTVLTDFMRDDEVPVNSRLGSIKQITDLEGYAAATKHEHSGPGGGAIETKELSHEDLARKLAFLLTRGDRTSAKKDRQNH